MSLELFSQCRTRANLLDLCLLGDLDLLGRVHSALDVVFGNEQDAVVIREHEVASLDVRFIELAAGERFLDGRERPLHTQRVRSAREYRHTDLLDLRAVTMPAPDDDAHQTL